MEPPKDSAHESLIESNWEMISAAPDQIEEGETALTVSKEEEQLTDTESFLRENGPLTLIQEASTTAYLYQLALQPNFAARARKCLGLLIATKMNDIPTMSQLCDALCDAFLTGELPAAELAFEALKTVVAESPQIDSINFVRGSRASKLGIALLDSVVPRLTGGITKRNVEPTMLIIQMVMRHFGHLLRQNTKWGTMAFLGDYFNTGLKLGHGTYANVFLGRHIKTAEVVAIKVMDWDRLTRGKPKLAEMLNNEIKIMRSADSPSIVHLYDVVHEGGNLNLVLEYCSGGNLEEYLAKHHRLEEDQVRRWLGDLASGLRFLHNRNIIHRDLKLGNLLLTVDHPSATLKITDFTFARFLEPGDLAASVVGTPLYMAPEVLRNIKYTEKADLWSVGVIIYQLLTGRLPYRGTTYLELMTHIDKGRVVWPADLEVSPDMKDLVISLLKKDPTLRISWPEFFSHSCVKTTSSIMEASESLTASVVITSIAAPEDLVDANKEIVHLRSEVERLRAEVSRLASNNNQLTNESEMESVYFSGYEPGSTSSVIVTPVQEPPKESEEVKQLKLQLARKDEETRQLVARLQIADARLHGYQAANSASADKSDPYATLQKQTELFEKLRDKNEQLNQTERELDSQRAQNRDQLKRIRELETELDVCRIALDQENRERAQQSGGWRALLPNNK
eukprot:TRINITY_DN1647_c0_g2_i1.p1 TRINITY_DN1647_c0_g2~~TRINITY_DN1647_c0_g2_i1.p1  ORF type:complete len:681 (-),score=87.06 TRINITY_DN1647_c0_g2_i1:168-2210(-)